MAQKKKTARSQDQIMVDEFLLVEGIDPPTESSVKTETKPSKPKKKKAKKKSKKKPRKVVKKYYYDDDDNSCLDDLFEDIYECLVGWWRD